MEKIKDDIWKKLVNSSHYRLWDKSEEEKMADIVRRSIEQRVPISAKNIYELKIFPNKSFRAIENKLTRIRSMVRTEG